MVSDTKTSGRPPAVDGNGQFFLHEQVRGRLNLYGFAFPIELTVFTIDCAAARLTLRKSRILVVRNIACLGMQFASIYQVSGSASFP